MFKIAQSPTYTWPVSFDLPADGGRTEKSTFDAVFKRMTQSQIDEMRKSIEVGEIKDAEMVSNVMVGWSGVVDDNGPVPFSQEALLVMADIPMVSTAIILAFLSSFSGAKRKN